MKIMSEKCITIDGYANFVGFTRMLKPTYKSKDGSIKEAIKVLKNGNLTFWASEDDLPKPPAPQGYLRGTAAKCIKIDMTRNPSFFKDEHSGEMYIKQPEININIEMKIELEAIEELRGGWTKDMVEEAVLAALQKVEPPK